jgi:tRNA-uridine 2-sulfurtransferase
MVRKALALISGGLDSMLAVRVIQEQGIEVHGINFYTGFCVEGHTQAIRNTQKPKRNNVLWVAETLGIKLHIEDVSEAYKPVLLQPKYGYGANMNPCLDCKIFMVQQAYQWIQEHQFDFIITGEVVGQRPMSQRKATMPIVAKESGADDVLLRPLSAKNLPETRPEREGWVNRDALYDFSGRSRKPQMALAKKFGFVDYATPAGGCCFLTDPNYARRLGDLWQHRSSRDYEMEDVVLLKVGRHIRPSPKFKLIIARDEGEVNFLTGFRKQYPYLVTVDVSGPMALIDGDMDTEDDKQLAARIFARFSKARDDAHVLVALTEAGVEQQQRVIPMLAEDIDKAWYV